MSAIVSSSVATKSPPNARRFSSTPESAKHSRLEELGHWRVASPHEMSKEAIGGDIGCQFVVIKQDPTQDFHFLVFVFAAEFPEAVDQIMEDGPGLAEAFTPRDRGQAPRPFRWLTPLNSSPRVTPLKKSTKIGSQSAPAKFSISAGL